MTSSTPDVVTAAGRAVADALAGRPVDTNAMRAKFARAEERYSTQARRLKASGRDVEARSCAGMADLSRRLDQVTQLVELGDPIEAACALSKALGRLTILSHRSSA